MVENHRHRALFRLGIVAVVSAVAASLVVPAAPAQEADEPVIEFIGPEPEIWEGPWTGMIFAGGDGTLLAQGIQFLYQLDLSGSLELEASDEFVIGTFFVEGEYSMFGETADASLVGVFDTVGSGEIVGTPTDLVMTGSADSDGIVEVTAQGQTQTVPAGSPNGLQFDIVLEAAVCNEVYGSFEADLEADFEDIGWNPEMQGNVIFLQDAAIIQQSLAEWQSGLTPDQQFSPESSFPPGTPDIVRVFDSVIRRFNTWADTVNGSNPELAQGTAIWEETANLLQDVNSLWIRLRNLSECEKELLGELSGVFVQYTTFAIFEMIQRIALAKTDLSGNQLWALTGAALGAAVFGGASMFPARAASAEAALIEAATRILERNIEPAEPADLLHITDDVKMVLGVAAQVGWALVTVGGEVEPSWFLSQLGLYAEDFIPFPSS